MPIAPPAEPTTQELQVTNHHDHSPNGTLQSAADLPEHFDTDSQISLPKRRASTDTYRQANGLFADFDGVHIPLNAEGSSVVDNMSIRRPSVTQRPPPARPLSQVEPPDENMVYYPAPVPMMLNLPQRLSKLPPARHVDRRRTEILGNIKTARRSTGLLPGLEEDGAEDQEQLPVSKTDRRTMANVPPQLRASIFFDLPAATQDVALKEGSAVATLDSILDASAFAPVSAFTDHPIVGQAGADVYERSAVRPRASKLPTELADNRKRRSSLNLLKKRNSASDLLDDSKTRASSILSFGTRFGNRKSSAPAAAATEHREGDEGAATELEITPLRRGERSQSRLDDEDASDDEAQFHDAEEDLDEYADEQQGAQLEDFNEQPTTLLAELQLRKQQQKQRTRNPAIAFPDGMHSTLLQLDAVAQVQKQAREKKHITLAWEDPAVARAGAENEDDEDVPLGVLYPGRKVREESRPLGLIARREMEDNEPLSHRRARLRGEDPRALARLRTSTYDLNGHGAPSPNGSIPEVEGETLGQRLKRLKAQKKPEISQPRAVSGDFASEILGQFGGAPIDGAPADPEEETLGQRRKRLQAEREANSRNVSGTSAEPEAAAQVSKRRSMADILTAHPAAGARASSNPKPTPRQPAARVKVRREQSSGALPMASGIGVPAAGAMPGAMPGYNPYAAHMPSQEVGGVRMPNPYYGSAFPAGGAADVGLDKGQRDMIDRWRMSVMH